MNILLRLVILVALSAFSECNTCIYNNQVTGKLYLPKRFAAKSIDDFQECASNCVLEATKHVAEDFISRFSPAKDDSRSNNNTVLENNDDTTIPHKEGARKLTVLCQESDRVGTLRKQSE